MFVPNEASLSAAFEHEPELLDYAIEQRVLITTPVTLLALLKTVGKNLNKAVGIMTSPDP